MMLITPACPEFDRFWDRYVHGCWEGVGWLLWPTLASL